MIEQAQRQAAGEVLADAGVVIAYLFGSRARGDHRQASDADIAILADRRLGLLERSQLAMDIADALGVPEVDLIVLDEVRLALRGQVVQEGLLLHSSDEPRRVDFEVRTRLEYFDFLPTLQAHAEAYLRHIAARGL
ncbi:MAG: type VII toxin-antitoxin system MntA family adenylyltransferase antitoxin [Egibacteraceae bacterium]